MPFLPHFLYSSSAAAAAFVATNSLFASADICRPSGSSIGTNGDDKPLSKPSKSCPDFKDGPEQSACCPSQITVGSFFCCTEAHKEHFEAQLASEARRRFISNHLAELVLACLALLVFLVLLGSFLCRRTRFCPMLHRRKSGASRSSLGGSLDSAEFLGAIRHSHFHSQLHHHHSQQQQNRLIPRPFSVGAVPNTVHQQQQRNNRVQQMPYCQRHRDVTVAEQQRKQQTTTSAIPTEAPPPYEEFVRVPPPPISVELPLVPIALAGEAVEEEENRLNNEREGQLRRPVIID